jgi:hypothetical protein
MSFYDGRKKSHIWYRTVNPWLNASFAKMSIGTCIDKTKCLTKTEVLALLREVQLGTTLHTRPTLLTKMIADFKASLI